MLIPLHDDLRVAGMIACLLLLDAQLQMSWVRCPGLERVDWEDPSVLAAVALLEWLQAAPQAVMAHCCEKDVPHEQGLCWAQVLLGHAGAYLSHWGVLVVSSWARSQAG